MANDRLNQIKKYYDEEQGNRQVFLWEYYIGKEVPIHDRVPSSAIKADSHTNVHTDFMKDIIDLKTGYMGQNITLSHPEEIVEKELKKMQLDNNMKILNSDTTRKGAISGITHKLCYTQAGDEVGQGTFKIRNIGPDVGTVVYDYTASIFNPDKAYFYYQLKDLEGKIIFHCDVYDKKKVVFYRSGSSVQDIPDGYSAGVKGFVDRGVTYVRKGSKKHNFNRVPIVPFINNDTMNGDCDKVISRKSDGYNEGLMDSYDAIMSDTTAEVKAMRLAYLKLFGKIYTGKDSDGNPISLEAWQKQTSTMKFAVDENGNRLGDAEFLEKNINDGIIENSLKRQRSDIYATSGSIDVKGISEGSNQRIISIQAQLMRLENNCATTESYMRAGFYVMFDLYAYWLREYKSIQAQPEDFEIDFKRVFPNDIQSMVEVAKIYVEMGVSLSEALRLTEHGDYETITSSSKVKVIEPEYKVEDIEDTE